VSTFTEIAQQLREMSQIVDPRSGGICGVRSDMELLSELAAGLGRLEFNIAVALSGLAIASPVDVQTRTAVREAYLDLLRAEVPGGQ
jgi:hypothetical protein